MSEYEAKERRRVLEQREIDRKLGKPTARRYDALVHVRETLESLSNGPIALNIDGIANLFSNGTVESEIVNEFSLVFAQEIGLTENDRKQMLTHQDNVHNLKAIPNAKARLANFPFAFQQWIETEMQATGLDDLFIPVSSQAGVLEEVDLYRVSLLSHLNDAESYHRMTTLVDEYLQEAVKNPSRVSDYDNLWQMVKIASLNAEHFVDWDKVAGYNRYLLSEDQQRFFLTADQSDRHRSQLSLARSLIQLSQKTYTDLIFMQDELEQIAAEQEAKNQLAEAQTLLEELATIEGDESSAITTRIQAKQMLNQMGA